MVSESRVFLSLFPCFWWGSHAEITYRCLRWLEWKQQSLSPWKDKIISRIKNVWAVICWGKKYHGNIRCTWKGLEKIMTVILSTNAGYLRFEMKAQSANVLKMNDRKVLAASFPIKSQYKPQKNVLSSFVLNLCEITLLTRTAMPYIHWGNLIVQHERSVECLMLVTYSRSYFSGSRNLSFESL